MQLFHYHLVTSKWMTFYNHLRPHQAMNNQFPLAAWRAGMDRIEAARTVDMPLRLDNANDAGMRTINSRVGKFGKSILTSTTAIMTPSNFPTEASYW